MVTGANALSSILHFSLHYQLLRAMDYTIDDNVLFYAVIKNVKHVLKLIKALEIKNVTLHLNPTLGCFYKLMPLIQ